MGGLKWRGPLVMFVLTAASLVHTGGVSYALSLLAILLAHEFGHFIAARMHGVPSSLPFFIPVPSPLSPFGTFGAIIGMRGKFPSRNALLDIGASGPLAGLCVAFPLYAWGVKHSTVVPLTPGMTNLGNSLALRFLDALFAPPTSPGMDVLLSPVAFAAWAGMFVTFVNLLPLGQLDGGHVAYALLGPRQNVFAAFIHKALLLVFAGSVVVHTALGSRKGEGVSHLGVHITHSLFFLSWFFLLPLLGLATKTPEERKADVGVRPRIFLFALLIVSAALGPETGTLWYWGVWFAALLLVLVLEVRRGTLRRNHTLFEHPPVTFTRVPLSRGRVVVAVFTLAMYALLFMPTPMSV